MKDQMLKIKNVLVIVLVSSFMFVMGVGNASAHVVVKPGQVGVGAFQTFTMGVPNEKDSPTIALRLVIPEGLDFVSPNVKPGWKVEVKKETGAAKTAADGDIETTRVTEISWTGGSIPVGQRDDFMFSAKVPASEATLQWKAYQTYANGVVVAWDLAADQQPKDANGKSDFSVSGPYSMTKVVNDLASQPKAAEVSDNTPLFLSGGAFVIALLSLGMQFTKKKKR